MVTVTAVVVASLLAAALLLWPARARHEVSVGLTELPRRRAELERREATTRSLRGALAADPVSAAASGVRGVLALLRDGGVSAEVAAATLETIGGRRVGRLRHRPDAHHGVPRHYQGVHHPCGRWPVPDRTV